MSKAILNRLIQAALVAFMVGLICFVMTRSLPGDLAYRIAAGRYGPMSSTVLRLPRSRPNSISASRPSSPSSSG